MNEYTASNGAKVVLTNAGQTGYILAEVDGTVSSAYLGFEQMKAWREFARAEEDERLGRWRWPENAGYIVYPDARYAHLVSVIDESTGLREVRSKSKAGHKRDNFERAAAAFFDAHPEPKPWHNAKPGEAWVVTYDGGHPMALLVADFNVEGRCFADAEEQFTTPVNDPQITAARRIYPEGD